ncbi:MAG: hypothetical protein JWO68_4113, partial [Actinomycetia bacterium]|nr:hypothetical protein [Actinomycetes bacterium]
MNILYINITGSLSLGGSELCFLDVMATMRRTRPDWSLSLIVGEDGAFLKAAEAIGVSCRVQPLPSSIAKLGEAGLRDREGRPRGRLAMAASAVA